MESPRYYISHSLASWETKQGETYMFVYNRPRHRRYGCPDGACVNDGLVGEGGRAMRSSVSERGLVGETDRSQGV